MDWLWSLGHSRLWLSTGAGTRAERFYRKLGWKAGAVDPAGELRLELDKP